MHEAYLSDEGGAEEEQQFKGNMKGKAKVRKVEVSDEEVEEEPQFKGNIKGKARVRKVEVSDEEVEEELKFKGDGKGKARVKKSQVNAGREDEVKRKRQGKGKEKEGRSKWGPKSKELVSDEDEDEVDAELKVGEEEEENMSGEVAVGDVEMAVDEAGEEELKVGQGGNGGEAIKRKRSPSISSAETKRLKSQLEPLPWRTAFKLPFRSSIDSCKQGFTLTLFVLHHRF
jgi:hypothetical protein